MGEPASDRERMSDNWKRLQDEVRRVSSIRLEGAPRTVLLEAGAVIVPGGQIPASLLAKMSALAITEQVLFIVLTASEPLPSALLSVPNLIARRLPPEALAPDAIVIACESGLLAGYSYTWHVGSGPAPNGMHPCRLKGAAGTEAILALYSAGLIQERAGAAFRAAGRGQDVPNAYSYDRNSILGGISVAVAPPRAGETDPQFAPSQLPDLVDEGHRLIRRAFASIELACVEESGAIAGAPQRLPTGESAQSADDGAPSGDSEEPDYWFFWQRDAGQVAVALTNPEISTLDPSLRARMRHVVDNYVSFVGTKLCSKTKSTDLSISRFHLDGRPVVGYGSPQNDGPAHTVLAVLTAVGPRDARRALELAKPYLELLISLASGAPTYDQWEFAAGRIFSTENLVRRALRRAYILALEARDFSLADTYGGATSQVELQLPGFFDSAEGYIRAGRDYFNPSLSAMSGLDFGTIGSVLVAYDVTDDFMNVDDLRVVRTLEALEAEFADRWPVNRRWKALGEEGFGVGRFPEDTNDGTGSTGGNPWVCATLWAAQYYLRLIQRVAYRHGDLDKDYSKNQLLARAEGYLRFVLTHMGSRTVAEQVDGQTGLPRGATELSWANAELINTLLIRRAVKTALRI